MKTTIVFVNQFPQVKVSQRRLDRGLVCYMPAIRCQCMQRIQGTFVLSSPM